MTDNKIAEAALAAKRLTVDERREIFHDLVTTQDEVRNVPQSRKIITQKYGISDAQLRKIEEEGINREWPPL
jgi:FlaA1/EpsC-like NDP-sugar epimerase